MPRRRRPSRKSRGGGGSRELREADEDCASCWGKGNRGTGAGFDMEEERTDRAAPRNPSGESQRLRQRAEAMVGRTEVSPTGEGSPDAVRLVHELSVHQIELELQNDELQRANLEAEEARQKYYDLYDRAPVAYVTLDQKGALIDMNLATANLLNQP